MEVPPIRRYNSVTMCPLLRTPCFITRAGTRTPPFGGARLRLKGFDQFGNLLSLAMKYKEPALERVSLFGDFRQP